METHYLDIDWSTTSFYEYSKVEKDGFESHTSSKGNSSFRKMYNAGVYGILQSVSVNDTKLGKKLAIRLKDGNDVYVAQFALYDQRGGYDNNFTEPLITMLPNMKKGEAYRVFPWSMELEKSNRKIYGVSIKVADLDKKEVLEGEDNKVQQKFRRRKRDEKFDASVHLPDLDFVDEFGSLKPTAISLDERKQFLTNLLKESLKVLDYKPSNSNQSTNTSSEKTPLDEVPQKTAAPEQAPTVEVDDDFDDLPF